jgi:hypothetical protein
MGASMESEKHQPVAAYVTDASSRYDLEQDAEVDAVFGEHKEGEVDYKSVGWSVQFLPRRP